MFPPLGTLDELISRSLGAGFAFITASIIVGIIWAFIEYGTSWIDNGLISISFITWGIYLALIFFRVSAGWRGRKAAILAIIALCLLGRHVDRARSPGEPARSMKLLLTGISHKTAPVHLREKLAIAGTRASRCASRACRTSAPPKP